MTDHNLLLKGFEAKFIEAVAEKAENQFSGEAVILAAGVGREVAQMDEAGRAEFGHAELMTLIEALYHVRTGTWSESETETVLARELMSRIADEFFGGDKAEMENALWDDE